MGTTNNTTERDKSLDISKKGALLVVLTICGLVALWFITNKLTKGMPHHQ